jgi:hypothetical protein
MSIRSLVLGATAVSALAFVIVGCNGRTESLQSSDDGGAESGQCVDISASSFDTSCSSTSDCISITAGNLCPGSCLCGGATINASGKAAYDEATQGVGGAECGCALLGTPTCIGGTCTICGAGTSDPPQCNIDVDAGTTEQDSGQEADASCVEIVVTQGDQKCGSAADCTRGPSGSVCSGSCSCWGTPMNATSAAELEKLVAPYATGGCPCVAQPSTLQCIQGTCMSCTPLEDGGFTDCQGG